MKKVSLLVVLCMLVSAVGVFAAGDSTEEMKAAIALVKERVEIPEACTEFTGNFNLYSGEKTWEFRWETPEDAEARSSVSVTLRADGIIENVYTYIYADTEYKRGKTLPVISAEEAKALAVQYSAKINPALGVQYSAGAEAVLSGDSYSVRIPRTVDGIRVYNNSAGVRVCSQTGRVESFYLTHSAKAAFPGTAGAMDAESAKNAYIQNGYMRLEYRMFDGQPRLVYTPGLSEDLIDAASGAPFTPEYAAEYARNEAMKATSTAEDEAVAGGAALTPQERQAVEEVAGLISYEAATEAVKSVPHFFLPENAVLEAGNTYKTDEGRYILRVSLRSADEESYARAYGELDGMTGEILYFYASDRTEEERKADEEQAKAAYDAFAAVYLSAYAPALAEKEVETTEKAVYITAERVENGIPVYGNGVSVTIEPSGKITSYRLDWERDKTFPAPENILSAADAYGVLFASAAPRLCYFAGDEASLPVYAMEDRGYAFIAASDSTKLSYNGSPYVAQSAAAYTDVAGHYAEEAILALASVDARLGDTEFKPDAVITQAEFVGLVSNCVMDYYPISSGTLDEARLYSYAVNQGILPKDEEAPDAPLTREMAVAYLLRAMDYGDFAEIESIFRCDFADADAINPALYGYVAIAKGLGIVNGDGSGNFAPAREMTRGEAAVIIYNYLK